MEKRRLEKSHEVWMMMMIKAARLVCAGVAEAAGIHNSSSTTTFPIPPPIHFYTFAPLLQTIARQPSLWSSPNRYDFFQSVIYLFPLRITEYDNSHLWW